MENFIDNEKRKKIVMFWIPACLVFLHVWASILILSAALGEKDHMDGETIRTMFSSCTIGIAILIGLLISDKALELIISHFGGNINQSGQVIEKTTTEKTVVSTPEKSDVLVNDVNMKVQGDVNVAK